jgi:hypothetical protein
MSAIGRFPKNPLNFVPNVPSLTHGPLTKRETLFVSNGSVSPSVLKSMLATGHPASARTGRGTNLYVAVSP